MSSRAMNWHTAITKKIASLRHSTSGAVGADSRSSKVASMLKSAEPLAAPGFMLVSMMADAWGQACLGGDPGANGKRRFQGVGRHGPRALARARRGAGGA